MKRPLTDADKRERLESCYIRMLATADAKAKPTLKRMIKRDFGTLKIGIRKAK